MVDEMSKVMFDAQLMTSKVVCGVSGGCMLVTSIVLLCFYIKNYIDNHRKELGILKALGFSDFRLAKGFSVFGFNVFMDAEKYKRKTYKGAKDNPAACKSRGKFYTNKASGSSSRHKEKAPKCCAPGIVQIILENHHALDQIQNHISY